MIIKLQQKKILCHIVGVLLLILLHDLAFRVYFTNLSI